MPNWCSNSIAFYQEDGGNTMIEAFYMDIQKYTNVKNNETGEISNWVGHWLQSSRVNIDNMYTRGFFSNCELNVNHVRIDMETAWTPLPEVWDLMAGKYELSYVYIAEEDGCAVYVNTDSTGRFFTTRYMMQSFEIEYLELAADTMAEYGERLREFNEEPLYFDSWEEVLREFEIFEFNALNLEELNQRLEMFNIMVHEYAYEY